MFSKQEASIYDLTDKSRQTPKTASWIFKELFSKVKLWWKEIKLNDTGRVCCRICQMTTESDQHNWHYPFGIFKFFLLWIEDQHIKMALLLEVNF